MKQRLVLLACLALGFGASPAFAFKNIEGCDIVTFASPKAGVTLAPEGWQSYHDAADATLLAPPIPASANSDERALAFKLIEAQRRLLAPVKDTPAYKDYLAGDSCRVLGKLNAGAVEALLDEAGRSTTVPAAASLRRVTEAARTQIDNIERSARFRSNRDKTLMQAQYFCFVAGAIVALLPPERQQAITLESFGETVSCKDAGRSG